MKLPGLEEAAVAVVAQEVGNLACVLRMPQEIDQVLRRIQSETVRSLEAGRQREVHDVREALQEITKAANDTQVLVQEIAKECLAQTEQTKEAVALFQAIGDVTEQTAAGTEETAASAQNLAELAQQLQSIIADFQNQIAE